jgi:hypothetical protein
MWVDFSILTCTIREKALQAHARAERSLTDRLSQTWRKHSVGKQRTLPAISLLDRKPSLANVRALYPRVKVKLVVLRLYDGVLEGCNVRNGTMLFEPVSSTASFPSVISAASI